MKITVVILFIPLILTLVACSGNAPEEMFELAKFEELQNNFEHALKIYNEIIEKHPDSEYAKKAKDRVAFINSK